MKLKRKLAAFLTGTMLLSTMSAMTVTAGAANYSDTAGHWAESAVDRWSGYGIVQGSGGAFRPNASMTRAEMATVLSKLLGLTDKASNSFADVSSGAWYADAVLKCAAAGILKGDGTGANPNGTITREEAAVMMGRALAVEETSGSLSFADGAQVSGWAKGYVKAMSDKGIVNGVGSNRFAPAQNIDRASVVTILDRTITGYANTAGATVEAKNAGLTLVAAPDVTVTGAAADVLVAAGAASGTVTLSGASVSGAVTVQAKADVALTGSASVGAVELTDAAAGATLTVGAGAKAGTVSVGAEKAKVEVSGTVTDVTIDAANVAVTAQKGGTIDTVTTTAKGTTVAGEGTVKTVKTNDKNDTKVTTKNTKVEQTGGAAEKPSTGGGSGGGGGGHSSTVTTADVSSPEELQKAFADADIATITLKGDGFAAGQDLALSREGAGEVEIKFGKVSLGDVTINAPKATKITLTDDGAAGEGAKCNSLTVDAAEAHVQNNMTVAGTVTIKAVAGETFVVGDKTGSVKLAGAGKLEIAQDAGSTPAVEVATDKNVVLSGEMAEISVTADAAKVKVAPEAKVGTITSTAAGVALTVATEEAVKVEGEIAIVALESKATLEVAAGASVGTLTSTTDNAVVSGEGEITAVAATNPITLSNAKVGTVTATAPVELNAAVEKVEAKSANVAISGTGNVAEVEAAAPVQITNKSVDKVSVPADAENVTITVAKDVTIPVVETKANVEIAGEGTVSTVDALANDVAVTASADTVAQVTAVGGATGVTVTDQTITVKTKAAAPSDVVFAEPETAEGKGKITSAQSGLEYSVNGVTYNDFTTGTEFAPGTYYVRVKATGDTLASEPVKGTIPATVAVSEAAISGSAIVGQTLAASVNADATSTKGHPITYSWKAGDSEVGTGKTLMLTDGMVGKAITVTIKNYDPITSTPTAVVQADKTALKSALKAAEAALTGVSGTDEAADKVLLGVQFVTTAQMKAYQDALAAANAVVSAADANTAAVAAAVEALNTALSTFNGQKQNGTWNEVGELQAALSDALKAADTAKANIQTSENGLDVAPTAQWVTADVMAAFDKTIADAAAVKDSTDAAVLGQALANVNAATASFGSAKKSGASIDTAKLVTAINNAGLNINSVTIGDKETIDNNITVVTKAVSATYGSAIDAAIAAVENPANQKAVNDALAALNEATKAFNDAKASGAVDKASLNAAIKAAAVNVNSVAVSKDGSDVTGQYVLQADVETYQTAIEAAQAVASGSGSDNTQEKVDAAVADLSEATAKFNAAKQSAKADKAALTKAIEDANGRLETAKVSDDGKNLIGGGALHAGDTYYNAKDVETYRVAIAEAQKVANAADSTQQQITAAVTALNNATTSFINTMKTFGTPVTTADTLIAAMSEGNTAVVVLQNDIEVTNPSDITGAWRTRGSSKLTLDLNGKKLTVSGEGSVLLGYSATDKNTAAEQQSMEADITIRNGDLIANNTKATVASFTIEKGQKLTLDGVNGVNVTASGSVFLPRGEGATLTVKNSTIETKGVYCISTNANDPVNYGVEINVEKSTLTAQSDDRDNCAVLINVPGTLNMVNSTITGNRQAVIVRAGTAKLTGCTINAETTALSANEHAYSISPEKWGDGNRVSYGALIVGNQTASTYKDNAAVTLTECILNAGENKTLTVGEVTAPVYALHAVRANNNTYSTTVMMDKATTDKIKGAIATYGDATINGQKMTTVATADALKTAMSDPTQEVVTLQNDITVENPGDITGAWRTRGSYALTLDLNGNTLTVSGNGSVLLGYNDEADTKHEKTASNQKNLSADVTICNGTLIANNSADTVANFTVEKGQKLTLDGVDGVTVKAAGSVFLPRGEDATLTVKNSHIETTGVYCISTNAIDSVNHGAVINVENSTLKANHGDFDDCAVLFNVPGTLNMKDSIVTGNRQGVIVRAGTATFDNCTINAAPQLIKDAIPSAGQSYNNWSGGNEVAFGALIVGNSTTSYPYDAQATLTNCTLNAGSNETLTAGNTTASVYALYAVREKTDHTTTVVMDAATQEKITGTVAKDGDKATITVDGQAYQTEKTNEEPQPVNEPAPEDKAEEPAVQPEPVQPEPTQPEDTAKPGEPVQSEPQVEVPEEKPAPNNDAQIVVPAEQEQTQTGETPSEETTPAEPTTEITTPDAPANDEPVVTAPANEI
ncbi:S-layer homology domain-containing protein [Butyricicoccus faecihominis]|uniref:S-layer homology domain-containing protein n=1 Tax=Butyricicoccus faecihominis TaxID=1712515 RepID=UPI00247A0EBD|nr:S-layer homology domain-containing protein [Butyricicoccus faecihominis]MCQ5131066.1 S-layer homology domain-containing protein [Butyricicoccus faecihominis]